MKIKMLDTVEDSWSYPVKQDGKFKLVYDVTKFLKGHEYAADSVPADSDWDGRATALVKMGKAVQISEQATA